MAILATRQSSEIHAKSRNPRLLDSKAGVTREKFLAVPNQKKQ
ncbi:hypothetical protein FHS09_001692 [Microbulbifer rhizosphaerae]|uniref:Uncharacterized protein n=1 Tax=Microbulbifer rhizosphaerae TaxID=1562603 RepID=A0A7W4WAU7_9GAMM|nr:hypothetical protein [Microbulbifer rhizosphaerae]